jgi:hypothetical protein
VGIGESGRSGLLGEAADHPIGNGVRASGVAGQDFVQGRLDKDDFDPGAVVGDRSIQARRVWRRRSVALKANDRPARMRPRPAWITPAPRRGRDRLPHVRMQRPDERRRRKLAVDDSGYALYICPCE